MQLCSAPLCCRFWKTVLFQILSNVLFPRHPQHFFLILIQLRVILRWLLEEHITVSESWRQMQELPSCPLEETLQSVMEIDSVCVSNLETTANRNPTRRDTINHNRRDVSVCSERSRSPAVFSVKCHCIIIKTGACWVITLLQSQSVQLVKMPSPRIAVKCGLNLALSRLWTVDAVVGCVLLEQCIENSTVNVPSQLIHSRKSKITLLKTTWVGGNKRIMSKYIYATVPPASRVGVVVFCCLL